MHIHAHGTGVSRGFTALELMITIIIAALLLTAGVPSLREFSDRQRLKSAVNALHYDLLLARAEAVHRRATVVACPGSPETGCLETANWSLGWMVFEDHNGDRQHQPDEPLLRLGQSEGRVRITGSAGRTDVRFFPDGSAPGSNGRIGFCGSGGPATARKLVISNIGRIRRDLFPEIDPSACA